MAGETPRGQQMRDAQRRARLELKDKKSSDVYYASLVPSVFADHQPGDHRGRPGEAIVSRPIVRKFATDSRDTDKYYADLTTPAFGQQPIKPHADLVKASPRLAEQAKVQGGAVRVNSLAGIPAAMVTVKATVLADQFIGILVPDGAKELYLNVRTAIDFMISRGEVTQEQAAMARLGYSPAAKPSPAPSLAVAAAPVRTAAPHYDEIDKEEDDDEAMLELLTRPDPKVAAAEHADAVALFMLRLFMTVLMCGSTAFVCCAAEPKKPNILMLFADDWRYDTLGCAGNPVVKTPNLDRLASEGVRFTHNCVTTSICGVSRATLLTGQWMSRHGCKAFTKFDTPWAETYAGSLRANGYHVGHVGKWHNGPFPAKEYDFGRSYMGKHWFEVDGRKVHVTQRNEEDALEFLKSRPANKPFCLTVAFFATHAEDSNPEQYLPQPASMKLYTDVNVPVPVNATEESWKRLPPFFKESNEGHRRWGWRFDTSEKYQKMMKNYYRLATEVDSTCGKILDELKAKGDLDNTLVIFTTDNGYFHAEHWLADKWYPHQESIRVPLIVRDPRMPKDRRGTTNDDFTLNVDLAPTLLAFTGVAAPKRMQGRDLSPLYLAAKKPEWRTEFYYEHATIGNKYKIPSSEGLVRKDWKYMFWSEFDYEQLFDLKADPIEEYDLARDPKHAAQLEEMRKRFRELKAAAK